MPRDILTWLLALLIATLLLAWATIAQSETLLVGRFGEHVITLTSERCALRGIANMPKRATWREPSGKVWESCYGASFEHGLVALYCSDRTVQLVPVQIFRLPTDI